MNPPFAARCPASPGRRLSGRYSRGTIGNPGHVSLAGHGGIKASILFAAASGWRDRSRMVSILLIATCYAAGLAVHYRWYERTAVPSLSFDEPVDHARWR